MDSASFSCLQTDRELRINHNYSRISHKEVPSDPLANRIFAIGASIRSIFEREFLKVQGRALKHPKLERRHSTGLVRLPDAVPGISVIGEALFTGICPAGVGVKALSGSRG
jgi:hypothetical protein